MIKNNINKMEDEYYVQYYYMNDMKKIYNDAFLNEKKLLKLIKKINNGNKFIMKIEHMIIALEATWSYNVVYIFDENNTPIDFYMRGLDGYIFEFDGKFINDLFNEIIGIPPKIDCIIHEISSPLQCYWGNHNNNHHHDGTYKVFGKRPNKFDKLRETEYIKYRKEVIKLTNKVKKYLFEKWNGKDYIDGKNIKNNLKLESKDKYYPTIDHKVSVKYCYDNNISAEECASIDNLCITTRSNNSIKGSKNES